MLLVSATAGEFFCDPDPAPPNLPAARLHIWQGSDGAIRLNWGRKGILQVTSDPATGLWSNVAMGLTAMVDPSDHQAAFYRVVAVSRPVRVHVPDSYDPSVPAPLLILLHGYTWSGDRQEEYYRLLPEAKSRGLLYCHPDGTNDGVFGRFWNADPACCDFHDKGIDDAAYLLNLIGLVQSGLNVDPKRIYLVGWSNGAHMAHRLARDRSDLIAAIACVAGTMSPENTIEPSEPVNVLQISGTADELVPFEGGHLPSWANNGEVIGAKAMAIAWGSANGCSGFLEGSENTLDLVAGLGQPMETAVSWYQEHPPGGAVELWTIEQGKHEPAFNGSFSEMVVEWLLSHPKP
jgi:polyhydroxybutyrate depolymerase